MRLSAKEYGKEDDVKDIKSPSPGTYHMRIPHAEIKTYPVKDPDTGKEIGSITKLRVQNEVLAGTIPGQEGLTHSQSFVLADDSRDAKQVVRDEAKLTRLVMSTGVLQPGEERDIDLENELLNRQYVVQLEEATGKDKKKYINTAEWGMAMWSINNPAVSSIPKDREALLMLGTPIQNPAYTNGNGANGSQQHAPQQQQQPQQQPGPGAAVVHGAAAANAAADPWAAVQ